MSLTEELLQYFGREIIQLRLIPSKGGVFEVEVNDELVFSKKETGVFPDNNNLIKEIASL